MSSRSRLSARDLSEADPAPDSGPRPPQRFELPERAVDCHAHVIGTTYIVERSYTPHPAPADSYLRMLDATGMAHGVLVQVSVHGTDNSLMLDTLRSNHSRLRGVAVIKDDHPQAGLRALKEAGVVGLRLNTTTGGGVGVGSLANYEAICKEMGWHLQFLVEGERLPDMASTIGRLRVPAIFDHMGYVDASMAAGRCGQTLLALVRDGAWVKLSGGFRLSHQSPPYSDTVSFARALAEAAPTRCVWGSDWPHVSFSGPMPNTGDLLDLLFQWVPQPEKRDAILAANAHRLYGFAESE